MVLNGHNDHGDVIIAVGNLSYFSWYFHERTFATNTVLTGGMNFIMIKAVLSLLEKQNESIVNLLNNVGSFSSNIEDNIDKTSKKAGMIFASGFDHRKVNPFVYIKFWRQACLPYLMYGVELAIHCYSHFN